MGSEKFYINGQCVDPVEAGGLDPWGAGGADPSELYTPALEPLEELPPSITVSTNLEGIPTDVADSYVEVVPESHTGRNMALATAGVVGLGVVAFFAPPVAVGLVLLGAAGCGSVAGNDDDDAGQPVSDDDASPDTQPDTHPDQGICPCPENDAGTPDAPVDAAPDGGGEIPDAEPEPDGEDLPDAGEDSDAGDAPDSSTHCTPPGAEDCTDAGGDDDAGIGDDDAGPGDDDGGPIVVDVDEDGVSADLDCDDNDSTVFQNLIGYTDVDGDGYTVDGAQTICSGAVLAAGFTATQSVEPDCDDNDSSVYQNLTGYADVDGDGYTLAAAETLCSGGVLASGFLDTASALPDCDDDKARYYPGAAQTFNGIDSNCDGNLDIDLARDAVTIVGENDGDLAGYAMAAGDVNGDGYPDVVVGSPGFSSSFVEGKVDIIFGGPDKLVAGASLYLGTDQNVSISGAGWWGIGESILVKDLNGDGKDDIIFGASYNVGYCGGTCGDGDGSGTGAVIIAYGREIWDSFYNFYDIDAENASTLSALQMALIKGSTGEGLGQRLLNIGDINGDGRDELLVGGGDGSRCDIIPVLPYSGIRNKSEIMSTEGGIHLHDTTGTPFDGWYCDDIASGDIDGDGLADLVAADTDRYNQAGNVVAIMGSPTFPSDVNFATLPSYAGLRYLSFYGNGPGYVAGSSLAAGASGIFIGVPGESGGVLAPGKIYEVPGAAITTIVNGASIRLDDETIFSLEGASIVGDIANAGLSAYGLALSDTRGDGRPSLVTSAWAYGGGTAGQGYLFGPEQLTTAAGSEISSATAVHTITGMEGTHFGLHIEGAVDVDGDGTDDPMFNAIGTTSVPAGPGRVYILSGGNE